MTIHEGAMMQDTMASPRRKRRAPQAAGPMRGPARNGADHAAAPPPPEPPPPADAGIAASVRAAYSVVERNIEEGRNAAERLRAAGVSQAEPPNAREIANRMLHLSRDLGATWMDLIGSLLREPDMRSIIDRFASTERAPHQSRPAPAMVTQRLSSRRPVEVTLSPLHLADATRLPGIAGLFSVAAGTPPVTGVGFSRRDDRIELALTIADDQPAGTYAGAIVDADTQAPIGTLMVRILE